MVPDSTGEDDYALSIQASITKGRSYLGPVFSIW